MIIKRDSTDTLVTYPPQRFLGTPSSATMRVETQSTSLPTSGDAATVDSVSASTNAAASEGDTSISFASDPLATHGRLYMIEDNGERYTVEVLESGTTTYLAAPLPADLSSGATMTGIAITHALTAAETSEDGTGFALVTATIDGVVRSWTEYFRVDDEVTPRIITGADLAKLFPEYDRLRSTDQDSPDTIVDNAWRLKLKPMLLERQILPERINNPKVLESAMVAAVRCYLTEQNHPGDIERLEDVRQQLGRALTRSINAKDFWYDAEGDEDSSPDDEVPGSYSTMHLDR